MFPIHSDRDPVRRYQPGRLLLRRAVQLVYPHRCPFCRRVLGLLPYCEECLPEAERLLLTPTHRLLREGHYFGRLEGAASVFRYEGGVRNAILRAKYRGEVRTAEELGFWMADSLFDASPSFRGGVWVPGECPAAATEYDVVVPVPSSHAGRGYNVPQRMALPLAASLRLPLEDRLLERKPGGKPQAGLSLEERLVNVAGAFRVEDGACVEGRRVLLVDDVITTGATAAACAQTLLDAGAESVFAVSAAAARV